MKSGSKDVRVKRLALRIMGWCECALSPRGTDLVLTPRFSPSTQEITYMEFGQGRPAPSNLFNIETGHREIVAIFRDSFSPRFSPMASRVIIACNRRQFEPVRDGFAFRSRRRSSPTLPGDRHLALLRARWHPPVLSESRTVAASPDLRDAGNRRTSPRIFFLREGSYSRRNQSGGHTPRRHIPSPNGGGQLFERIMKPDRLLRADSTSGFTTRTDLCAERPCV